MQAHDYEDIAEEEAACAAARKREASLLAQETAVLKDTSFVRCTFGPDETACEACKLEHLQLYYCRTSHEYDEGKYYCLHCVHAEKLSYERDADIFELTEKLSQPDIVYVVREIGRRIGWAIGTHGSMSRDIDLIAVPWTSDAKPAEDLVSAIQDFTGYTPIGTGLTPMPGGRQAILLKDPKAVRLDAPEAKGHWSPMAIDLSIVSRPASVAVMESLLAEAPCTCPNPEPHDYPHDPTNTMCYRTTVDSVVNAFFRQRIPK